MKIDAKKVHCGVYLTAQTIVTAYAVAKILKLNYKYAKWVFGKGK